MKQHICPNCKGELIEKDGKLVCSSCSSVFKLNAEGKLVSEPVENVMSETSSGSNIDNLLLKIDQFLKEDNKDVRGFYKKVEIEVKERPITLEQTKLIPGVIDKNINSDQLLIYGSGFKNFKKKQKRLHEKELAKERYKVELNSALIDLQNRFGKYKGGLYSPSNYNRIKKLFNKSKGDMESISYEDDYKSEFNEIKYSFTKKANKVLTLSAAKRRKAEIIIGSSLGGAAVIGILICGSIPTINYKKDNSSGYYGMVENNKHVLEANPEYAYGNSNGLKVTGVSGLFFPFHFPMPDITIPAEVNGAQVTGVDSYAFQNENINSISGGENLIWIGEKAFSNNNIESLDFKESRFLNSIGNNAFSKNKKLTSVTGLGSVRYIGDYAFANCNSLNTIDTLDYVNQIGYGAFENTSINSVNIGSGARYVAYDAFDSGVKINYAGSFYEWENIYNGSNRTSFDRYIIKYSDPYFGYKTKELSVGERFTLAYKDKVGYQFLGYYAKIGGREIQATSADGYSTIEFLNSSLVNEKDYISLYPKYSPIVYNVKFISNGGSDVSPKTYTVEKDLNLDTIKSSRPGYNFKGWSINGSGTTLITSTNGLNKDLSLYAIWEKRTYTITSDIKVDKVKVNYHYNNSNMTNKSEYYDTKNIKIPNNLTRSGYYFGGWYLDSNLTTKFNENTKIKSSMDLYAKWVNNYYGSTTGYINSSNYASVTVDNSGTTKTITVDNSQGLKLNLYCPSSYNSYVTIKNEAGNTIVSEKYISSYSSSSPMQINIPSTESKITLILRSSSYYGTSTIYYWFTNDSEIKINAGDVKTTVNVKFNESYELPVVQKPGSAFKGYFTKPNGLGTKLTDENGKSVKKWDIDEDVNAYSYYEKTNYTISYNVPEGVTNDNSNKTVYNYGDTYALKDLKRTGYTFNGWYKDTELTQKITSLTGLYENLTLTPKFTPISVDLTLNGLTGTKRKVTFDYLDDAITNKVVYLNDRGILLPPEELDGYKVTWYKDSKLTEEFDFSKNITLSSDLTLYAKKTSYEISNPNNYPLLSKVNSNSPKSQSVNSSGYNYHYYVADKTTYINMYSKTNYSGSYYKINLRVDNVTTNKNLLSSSTSSSSYTKNTTFKVNKGDVIKVGYSLYNYSNTLYYYFSESSNVLANIKSNQILTVEYDKPFEVSAPTKPGAIFKGFYTKENGLGTKVIDENGKSVSNSNYLVDTPLYAYFKDVTYTITYKVDSGINNPNASLTTYNYGDTNTFADLEKTGYTFDGWYKDSKLTQKVTSLTGLFENLTLTPKFTPISVDLTLNGLTGTRHKVTFDYLDDKIEDKIVYLKKQEKLLPPEELDGYKVTWYKDSKLTEEFDFSKNKTISSDLTLYAKKTPYEFSNPNNYPLLSKVDSNSPKSQSVSSYNYYYHYYVADKTTYINMYSKTYSSGSYYYSINLKVDNVTTNKNLLSSSVNSSSYSKNTTFKVNKGDVIKVGYSLYNYSNTLYYYFSEASNAIADTSANQILNVEYEKPFEVSVPVKPGYAFKGYYTEQNGLGTKVIDENGKSVSNSKYLVDTSLYAYFEETNYTITYHCEGTTNPNANLTTYNYGDKNTLLEPSKDNYTFLGWYDGKASNAKKITSLTDCFGNLDLYARFEGLKVNVTCNIENSTKSKITLKYIDDPFKTDTKIVGNGETISLPTQNKSKNIKWFFDKECTEKLDFNENIQGNITLYAKEEAPFVNETSYKTVSYYNSNNMLNLSTSSSASSIYLVCDDDVSIDVYYKNNNYGSSYTGKLTIYNETSKNYYPSVTTSSTSFSKLTITANKGDVLKIDADYVSSYSSHLYVYFVVNSTQKINVTAVTPVEVEYGSSFTLPVRYKPGYTFKGYFDSNDKQITDGNGASLVNSTFKTNVSLTPKYELNTYTIEYVLDESYTNPNANLTSYQYGQTNKILPVEVGNNMEFIGWYDNPDYYGSPITSLTNLDTSLTLYARIDEKQAYVKVEGLSRKDQKITLNYGIEGVENKIVELKATDDQLSIPGYTRKGYTCSWYYDKKYTQPFDFNNPTYGDFTLYAKWTSINNSTTLGNISNYTAENNSSLNSNYDYSIYSFDVDISGTVYLYYKATKTNDVRFTIMDSRENPLYNSQFFDNSTFEGYKKVKLNLTSNSIIKIKTDCYNGSDTNTIKMYFERGTNYSSTSNAQQVLFKLKSGMDLGTVTKEGYTFKGLFTKPNGEGTKVVDETGKSILPYSTSYTTLYAYFVNETTEEA